MGIETKAEKAETLVSQIEPERIMIESSKADAKLEAMKAKIQSNESLNEKLFDEIREIRREQKKFKGINEAVRLAFQAKKDLESVRKTLSLIDRD